MKWSYFKYIKTLNKIQFFRIKKIKLPTNRKLNSNIFVTNLDEIVFSNLDDMLSQKLSNEFDNNFNNFKLNHYLTKDYKLINPFNILPISPNGDLAGYFIIEKMDNKNEELIKFALSFFESYFETI